MIEASEAAEPKEQAPVHCARCGIKLSQPPGD